MCSICSSYSSDDDDDSVSLLLLLMMLLLLRASLLNYLRKGAVKISSVEFLSLTFFSLFLSSFRLKKKRFSVFSLFFSCKNHNNTL